LKGRTSCSAISGRRTQVSLTAGRWLARHRRRVSIDEAALLRSRRLKRFAKLGGETISLATVENCAFSMWPDHSHAAVVVPDERRGEQIALLTTNPQPSAWTSSVGRKPRHGRNACRAASSMPARSGARTGNRITRRSRSSSERKSDHGSRKNAAASKAIRAGTSFAGDAGPQPITRLLITVSRPSTFKVIY